MWFTRQKWSIFQWALRQRERLNLCRPGCPGKQNLRQSSHTNTLCGAWSQEACLRLRTQSKNEGKRHLMMCHRGGHIPAAWFGRTEKPCRKHLRTHIWDRGRKGKAFIQWPLPPLVQGSAPILGCAVLAPSGCWQMPWVGAERCQLQASGKTLPDCTWSKLVGVFTELTTAAVPGRSQVVLKKFLILSPFSKRELCTFPPKLPSRGIGILAFKYLLTLL